MQIRRPMTAVLVALVATASLLTTAGAAPAVAETTATPPSAPTSFTLTATATHVQASWQEPADLGGSFITGYRITIAKDGGTPEQHFVAGSTLSFEMWGTAGTYTATVRAENVLGEGPESAPATVALREYPYPFATWGDLVDQQYRDLLGRAPTAAERAQWVDTLTTDPSPGGNLIAVLRTDDDQTTRVDPVVRLYQSYLQRIPDRGGLVYWVNQKRAGRSIRSISSSFAASPEFQRRYGSLTNRAFVERIYQHVLGRPGDAAGIAFWTSRLDRKVENRGSVMVRFSESSEYREHQRDIVAATVVHTFLLGRAPTPAELADDLAVMAAGYGRIEALASALLRSDAYFARFGG